LCGLVDAILASIVIKTLLYIIKVRKI